MRIEYRTLGEGEISSRLFEGFERRQEVTRCWRKVRGEWVVRDIAFVDDWNAQDYERLAEDLRRTVREGGLVTGAFAEGRLKGFCAVDGQLKGSRGQYADLESLHVSRDMRGQGMGRQLFELACEWARGRGALSLYMSTHSSVESHAFYVAMGCVEAEEYLHEHVECEPYDVQMERRL